MTAQFGDTYARSVAKDHIFAQLGNRTAEQALTEGIETQAVWRAVCEAFEVPERLRLPDPARNRGRAWRVSVLSVPLAEEAVMFRVSFLPQSRQLVRFHSGPTAIGAWLMREPVNPMVDATLHPLTSIEAPVRLVVR
jgi:hypothetical protein